MSTTTLNRVRFVADYHMLGDMEAEPWLDLVMGYAMEQKQIVDYKFLYGAYGVGGLQLVSFTVDAMVPMSNYSRYETVKDYGAELLNGIVHDTDVIVRWVSFVGGDEQGTDE